MRRRRWQRHRKRYGAVAKSSSIQPCVVVWAEFWPWLYTFLLEKHGAKRATHSSKGNGAGHQQPECRKIDTDLPCRIFFSGEIQRYQLPLYSLALSLTQFTLSGSLHRNKKIPCASVYGMAIGSMSMLDISHTSWRVRIVSLSKFMISNRFNLIRTRFLFYLANSDSLSLSFGYHFSLSCSFSDFLCIRWFSSIFKHDHFSWNNLAILMIFILWLRFAYLFFFVKFSI